MSYLNITKRETQAARLGVMIARCSPDSQHGRPDRHPANVGCSLFMYMNDDISNDNDLRPERKTWTREVWGCPRGVMVKAMNCGIVVREFVLQSRYYVHFRANTLGKGMNPLILPPAMDK